MKYFDTAKDAYEKAEKMGMPYLTLTRPNAMSKETITEFTNENAVIAGIHIRKFTKLGNWENLVVDTLSLNTFIQECNRIVKERDGTTIAGFYVTQMGSVQDSKVS